MLKDAPETSANMPISPAATPKLRFRATRCVAALVVREMITTYGRSPGGYVWAVAQPLALISILSLAFSLLLRSPPLGTNFMLFYATGMLPLRMFQMLSSNVGGALQFSKPLLGYPRVTFVDAILGRTILVVLTQFVVIVLIISNIRIWTESSEIMDYGRILEAFCYVIILGVGVGVLNCFLFTLLPVWRVIWGIITGPLILISAVLYIYEDLPIAAQKWLWFNPLVHLTGLARTGFYSTYAPNYINLAFVTACALIPAFFGFLMLRRYGRSILYL